MMRKNIQTIAVATALLAGLTTTPIFGQGAQDHSKKGKMSGKKMSHEEMTAKLDKMSAEEKAAMIDKMPAKEKMAAMKTAGQESSKMSAKDKADMFDKMPADKKMKMMRSHEPMMHKGGKMGKMEKP